MKIVKYQSKHRDKVSFVILDTYKKFCAKDATKDAAKEYKTICDSKKSNVFGERLKNLIFYILQRVTVG